MDGYFRGVYGAPRKKGELVRMLMREQGYSANEVMFVGDALTDLEAAKESGIPFIARLAEGTHNMFEGMNLPIIRDLTELRPL
jgi:phosphoglycolate phosphatase-like HAD superfamily hydrolase